ncbi:MAG TPA: DUF998 domain-containing protein [Gaiellaceae bacterium]|nr:DUF998 domain-containing protein [Gaiellaceae bacterium]
MPLRLAGVCGLLAPVTFVVGVFLGDLAQPDAFSPADDDISDLGALTATKPWLYNQVAANLTGLLILGLAAGLWVALGRSVLARVGVVALAVLGAGIFLDGLFRLDCQGIDVGCENDSWRSTAHRVEGGFTRTATLVAPIVLAVAFRRLPEWRRIWLPTLLAIPAAILVGIPFSGLGAGAATRATSVVLVLWVGLVGFWLLRAAERRTVGPPP